MFEYGQAVSPSLWNWENLKVAVVGIFCVSWQTSWHEREALLGKVSLPDSGVRPRRMVAPARVEAPSLDQTIKPYHVVISSY